MGNTKEKDVTRFKYEAERYLNTFGIEALRTYGRSLRLEAPTKLRKGALIAEILKVLCKEIFPQRNKKGAPIKSRCVDEQIIKTISNLKSRYLFDEEKPIEQEWSPEKDATTNLSSNTVLHFTVTPALLNKQQKSLLNAFLNSL